MDVLCQDCGKPITSRAKANVWNGERIICTTCLHLRKGATLRRQAAIRIAGIAGSPWLIHDGHQQSGPFPTTQLIELLRTKRVDWTWNVWREGMEKWVPAGQIFTIPELSNGRIEVRDYGQGDGTHRFTPGG